VFWCLSRIGHNKSGFLQAMQPSLNSVPLPLFFTGYFATIF
jgi:hypothetical protein